jgi:hypothetical protein
MKLDVDAGVVVREARHRDAVGDGPLTSLMMRVPTRNVMSKG